MTGASAALSDTPADTQQQAAADPAAAAAAPAATAAADWTAGLPDELKAVAAKKNWTSPADAVKAYGEAERMLGDRIPLPKDGDQAAADALYKKLGWPGAPEGYDLDIPKDAPVDDAFVTAAKGFLNEARVPAPMAKAIVGGYLQFAQARMTEMESAFAKQQDEGLAAIDKEWGASKDSNMAAARRAAGALKQVGLDQDQAVEAIERAIGTAATMKLFAALGSKFGEEARFVDGDPAAAQQDILKKMFTPAGKTAA